MALEGYPVFVATDATALEGGRIYLGVPNADPETSPIGAFWDADLTVPAAMPLLTSGGVIVRDGAPANVYAAQPYYSIRVRDRTGRVVWYKPEAGGNTPSTRLSFPIPGGPPGDPGSTGPADNTYTSYAALLASDKARKSARLVGDTDVPAQPDGNFTVVDGAWVRQKAASTTYGKRRTDESLPVTLAYLGVPNSTGDVSAQLRQAVADANGDPTIKSVLADANATYRKDGPLTLDVSFDGQGSTLRGLSNGPQGIIAASGASGIRWVNFTTLSAATDRDTAYQSPGIVIGDQGLPQVVDVWLENIVVDGVEAGKGPGGVAFWFANLRNLRGIGLIARNSKADGFHFVHGARHCVLVAPIAENVGDDAFPVISYRSSGLMCEDIHFISPYAFQPGSRGCSVVGGRDVYYHNPRIDRSAAAAVYFNSEDAFDTYGVLNAHVTGLKATNCVQGGGATGGAGFENPVIFMGGRSGSDFVDGYTIQRTAADCSVSGDVLGVGPRVSYGATVGGIRSRLDVDLEGITGKPGVFINGQDADVRMTGRGIGGVPIVLDAAASGRILIHDSKIDSARTANPPADVNVLLGNAANVSELRLDRCQFDNSSGTLVNTDSGFDLNKLRYNAVKINGVEKGKDCASATVTVASGWATDDARAFLYADGTIRLVGMMRNGTDPLMLTLPAGYRPAMFLTGQAIKDAKAVGITVNPNGEVRVIGGGTGPGDAGVVYLNMSFPGAG